MRTSIVHPVLFALAVTLLYTPAIGRDAARDLRKMKGFTIIDAAVVKEVVKGDGVGKRKIVLDNGVAFEVDLLLLDPLPLTDVIIFAKPLPKELREKFKDLPEHLLNEYKLLFDNEAYDARPVR